MGTLYIVSTPIGNLEDITLRALRILREVSLIAAEDTRHTKRLLNHYGISTPCRSYHEHNKLTRLDDLLAALAMGDVALVSDAGTPLLSDPGFELVNACTLAGVAVVPVPGASAPMAALVASGLPTDAFLYVGFLPRRSAKRRTYLQTLAHIDATLVCFEAPHRLLETLHDVREVLGERRIAVAREITKLHEEVLRLSIGAAIDHFTAQRPRGECTLVIAGATDMRTATEQEQTIESSEEAPEQQKQAVLRRLRELRDEGQSSSEAARTAAREFHLPKGEVYQLWLRSQDK